MAHPNKVQTTPYEDKNPDNIPQPTTVKTKRGEAADPLQKGKPSTIETTKGGAADPFLKGKPSASTRGNKRMSPSFPEQPGEGAGVNLLSPNTPFTEYSTSSTTVGSVGRSAKQIILDQVIHSERHQNNISLVYRETLRSMIKLFAELFYINAEEKIVNIKSIHGNPERTIAKLKQETNIILPIISVNQTVSEDDLTRRKTEYTLIVESWWDDTKKRAYRVVSMAPRAVNIKYSVNVWAKYNSDLDQITEQVRRMFFPSADVATTYSSLNQAFLTEEVDQSAVNIGDKEDRILRKAFMIDVETYIPTAKYLVTSTGQIEKIKSEMFVTKNIE